jgi:hypothetical protein
VIGAAASLLLLLALASPAAARLTPAEGWSPPEDLFHTAGRIWGPLLLADPSDAVHLFYRVTELGGAKPVYALWYARWADGRWSAPREFLRAPEGTELSQPAVALDGEGMLHLIYHGPQWGSLAHQAAPLGSVTDPRAWRAPVILSRGSVLDSTLSVGADDTLHALYASTRHQLFAVRSENGGRSWSDPVQLSALDPTKEATIGPELAVDGGGRLHAVWGQSTLPKGWPPAGVYYARSSDAGRSWTAPLQLAPTPYAQANVAARGEPQHLAWGSVASTGHRVHQWSADGGQTWSTPALIGHGVRGGITGAPMLAFDSTGALHLVTSIDGPHAVERVVHLSWDGEDWSRPVDISTGTGARDSVEWPALTVTGGARLHAAWETDYHGIWYAGARLDVPALPPRPLPTPDTRLWRRVQDWSPQFRIFLLLIALLGADGALRALWRARRGAAA